MAKVATKTADQLVLEALEKALIQGPGARLVTFGKKPENAGLFPDESKPVSKAAIEKCLSETAPLLCVEREESQKSRGKTVIHRFVKITPLGINFLLSQLPSDRARDLLAQSQLPQEVIDSVLADSHLPAELSALLLNRQLQDESAHVQSLEKQWTETAQAMRQRVGSLERSLNHYVESLRSATNRLENEMREVRERTIRLQEKLSGMPPTTSRPPTEPPSETATEEELGYRRRLTQQMVFAWEKLTSTEDREHLECALLNSGVEQIGKVGERTTFVGRLHECMRAFQDDPVEIVQPGWLLRENRGEYPLAKAQVKLVDDRLEEPV